MVSLAHGSIIRDLVCLSSYCAGPFLKWGSDFVSIDPQATHHFLQDHPSFWSSS